MIWTAERIKGLRKRYDETQGQFCHRLGVGVGALRFWEQGQGVPSCPVQILLERLEEDIDRGMPRPMPGLLQEA